LTAAPESPAGPRTPRAIGWLFDAAERLEAACGLGPPGSQARYDSQHDHFLGTFGLPFHHALGAVACAAVAGPVGAVELAGALAAGVFVARLPFVWRMWPAVARQPACVLAAALLAWIAASAVINGRPPSSAVYDLGYGRWAWALFALHPALGRRGWLIGAVCVGFALAFVAQALELIGHRAGVPALVWSHPPAPDPGARVSGWWHQPAIGGVMCAVAVGLHIGPALAGRGWRRWAGVAGAGAGLAGAALTGSRGGMIAAAGVACVAAALVVVSAGAAVRRRVLIGVVAGAAVLGAGVASPPGAPVRERFGRAWREVGRAVEERDFRSDTGARVFAAIVARGAFAERPVAGIGPGRFNERARAAAAGLPPGRALPEHRLAALKTAHGTVQHALATLGVVGAALVVSLWGVGVLGGLVCARRAHPGASFGGLVGTYAFAPVLGLVALALGGVFETVHLNASTAAVATVLVGLCAFGCPRPGPSLRPGPVSGT